MFFMKHVNLKLTVQPILVFFVITIILLFNMYSVVDGKEFNDRFEYDIEKRYYIKDQINLEYDIKSLGLKIPSRKMLIYFQKCIFSLVL